MPSHDVNWRDWLATPEGPPERIWQAALGLIASEEDPEEVHDDHQDQSVDEVVEDGSFEVGGPDLADTEPHTTDEGPPVAYDEEDFGVDPYS